MWSKSKDPTTMSTTIPATVLTGVTPWFEGATVAVACDVGCDGINPDDAGVVEDAVDKLVLPAVLLAAVAEDVVVVVEASLILK